MNYTGNLELKKPLQDEYYNVDDFNFNADSIDAQFGKIPNRNLLDNWFFGNPVNSRKSNSASAGTYGIDRWKAIHGPYSLYAATPKGIWVPENSGILQYLEKALHSFLTGKFCTFSCLDSLGTLYVATTSISDTGTSTFDLEGMAVEYVNSNDFTYISLSPESGSVIIACKLELGTFQTLASRKNNSWVLNDIPNMHTESLKCLQSKADPNDPFANFDVAAFIRGNGIRTASVE